MFENEPDSEDDFEGYFLRPVNEYNIVDRIKEANKELFATPQPPSPSILIRKVTFRHNLEDYEPHDQREDDPENSILTESNSQESGEYKSGPLDSETSTVTALVELTKVAMSDSSDHEIEEICEEIQSIDIETEETTSEYDQSDITEIEQKPKEQDTSHDRSSTEDLSTSFSQSSDDNLSVIVASYTSDEKKPNFNDVDQEHVSKAKEQQSPTRSPSARSKRRQPNQYNNDVLKLQLNYKSCCEYKNAVENLPRYSGYFSQYGLSKEQWERKEKRIEKSRKKFLEKSCTINEAENKKVEDNERAFTSWLRNKMRCPINKTKNMFDFKPNRLKRMKNKAK